MATKRQKELVEAYTRRSSVAVLPEPEDLTKAVETFLFISLSGRRYCPRCMGLLPAKHADDCIYGMLARAYRKVVPA